MIASLVTCHSSLVTFTQNGAGPVIGVGSGLSGAPVLVGRADGVRAGGAGMGVRAGGARTGGAGMGVRAVAAGKSSDGPWSSGPGTVTGAGTTGSMRGPGLLTERNVGSVTSGTLGARISGAGSAGRLSTAGVVTI